MALVDLRELANSPNAAAFDKAGSPLDRFFAEDWQDVRRAIQLGAVGIKSRDIEAVASMKVGTELTVTGGVTLSAVLAVAQLATFDGGAQVNGNLGLTGTVAGVNLGAHQHSGADGTPKIPLSALIGVGGSPVATWATHNHSGDGSSQVDTAGLAASAVTFAKIDSSAIGLVLNSIARGSNLAAVRARFQDAMFAPDAQYPMLGQWISALQMQPAGSDTEAAIAEDIISTRGYVGREFPTGSARSARFTFPLPSTVLSPEIIYVFWVDAAVPGSPAIQITQDLLIAGTGGAMGSGTSTSTVLEFSGSQEVVTDKVTGTFARSSSPAAPELVTVRLTRSATDGVAASLYLAGAFVRYDPDYASLD